MCLRSSRLGDICTTTARIFDQEITREDLSCQFIATRMILEACSFLMVIGLKFMAVGLAARWLQKH
jgi:hypothetical protein